VSVFTNRASTSAEQARAYTAAVLDLVGTRDPMEILRTMEPALRRALDGLSERQTREPEQAGKWSARHVVQHLSDSELVWGYRLRMVLAQDRPALTGYDQDLWAERLRYDEARAEEAVEQFAVLRRANLRLLTRSSTEDLRRVGVHAERGEESVEHMIRLYAGHDLLHLAQLDRIRRAVMAG
jgi:uncharacterized damage-inducible protein DinB